MAVTTQTSVEYAQLVANASGLFPTEHHGTLRFAHLTHDQVGAGDATSSVAVARLPAGRVRLFLPSSVVWCNWTTASATGLRSRPILMA
jgi:hypothetical protein